MVFDALDQVWSDSDIVARLGSLMHDVPGLVFCSEEGEADGPGKLETKRQRSVSNSFIVQIKAFG